MKMSQLILFCILAYLISWTGKFFMSAQEIGWISHELPTGMFQLVAQFGPTLAGLLMITATGGRKGLQSLIKKLLHFNVHYKWYLFALIFELLLFLVIVLGLGLDNRLTLNASGGGWLISLKNFMLNTFYLSLLTGLGEEIGWRGFLLPRLQSRFPVLVAAVISAMIASFWHLRTADITLLLQGDLPAFSSSYFPDMGLRLLISIPALFMVVYLFNKTRGSLVIMILLHGASNASHEWVKEITGIQDPSFLLPWFALSLWLASAFFILALIRMEKKKEIITTPFSSD